MSLGHTNACNPHTINIYRLHIHLKRWRRARSYQTRQSWQQGMVGVQAGGLTTVLNSQPQLTALGVGQTNQRLNQVAV